MIQRPFYPEGPVCHGYVLHPPGGIVGGDRLSIDVQCTNNAAGLVTTPGATKYYGSDGRLAQQYQHITVHDGNFEWMPQESIFFDRCIASQQLRIDLQSASRFIGWDINCLGRPAGNHQFKVGCVSSRFDIHVDEQPILLERLRVNGEEDVSRSSGLRGATTNAIMVAYSPVPFLAELLDGVRGIINQTQQFSVTQLNKNLIVVRYLGGSSEQAREGFIAVWQMLRPIIMQRQAVLPRIWAT
jgi:urease accessory protein